METDLRGAGGQRAFDELKVGDTVTFRYSRVRRLRDPQARTARLGPATGKETVTRSRAAKPGPRSRSRRRRW